MGKEQFAVDAVNNFLSGEDEFDIDGTHSPRADRFTKLYQQSVFPGNSWHPLHELIAREVTSRRYFPEGIEGGEVIDIGMGDIAISELGPNDALVTWGLADCLGLAMKVREVDKKLGGLRTKEIPDKDFFVLGHLPYAFLGTNDLIDLVMKDYRVLGIAISATPEVVSSTENILNLPHLRLRGLRPQVKIIDPKNRWSETSGIVVTREGGAFLRRQTQYEGQYVVNSTWSWQSSG